MTNLNSMNVCTPNDTHRLSTHSLQSIKPVAFMMIHELYGTDFIPLRALLRSGNKKIPNTTAIFNMASAHKCPSKALGLCKAEKAGVKCYAIKSEVASRPNVQPFRERQMDLWWSITAHEFALQFILINALRKPTHTYKALRFNEAGDFHTQECVNKAEKIARILKPYGVICYCYTSRDDLRYNKVTALKISGSGFKKEGIVNIFKIVERIEDKPKGYVMCPMNCKVCDRCMKSGKNTAVLKH